MPGTRCGVCGQLAAPKYLGGFPFCDFCQRFVDPEIPREVIYGPHEVFKEGEYSFSESRALGLRRCFRCQRWRDRACLEQHDWGTYRKKEPREGLGLGKKAAAEPWMVVENETEEENALAREWKADWGKYYLCCGGCDPEE